MKLILTILLLAQAGLYAAQPSIFGRKVMLEDGGHGTNLVYLHATSIIGNVENVHNVKSEPYNALGDGSDETSTIQDVIDAVEANEKIDLAGGSYDVNVLVIEGKNNVTIRNGTFRVEGTPQAAWIQVTNSTSLTFENVVFDGNGEDAIWMTELRNSPNVTFRKCTWKDLSNVADTGSAITGLYIRPGSHNALIENCVFTNFTGYQVVRGIWIGNFGASTERSEGVKIVNNSFYEIDSTVTTDSDGIVVDQDGLDSGTIIEGNWFVNCEKRWVKIIADGVTVSGNQGRNSQGQSFSAISAYGERNVITGNSGYSEGAAYNIYFVDTTKGGNIIIGNTFSNSIDSDFANSTVAIRPDAALTGLNVSNNRFWNFNRHIFSTYDLTNIKVQNNDFLNSVTTVIELQGVLDGVNVSHNFNDTSGGFFFNSSDTDRSNVTLAHNDVNASSGFNNGSLTSVAGRNDSTVMSHNVNGSTPVPDMKDGTLYRYAETAPSTGSFKQGDRTIITSLVSGGQTEYVCVEDGSPGTWVPQGLINDTIRRSAPTLQLRDTRDLTGDNIMASIEFYSEDPSSDSADSVRAAIRAYTLGFGTAHGLQFETKTDVAGDPVPRWVISTAGTLRPYADDTYDIGGNTNKVKDIYATSGKIEAIGASSLTVTNSIRADLSETAGNTRFLLWDVDNGQLERVTVGAADSGGSGFKVLRIPN